MKYTFQNQQDKRQYARQLADYISRNKFKATKTNEDLYSSILKSLKDSKGVQLHGMSGFKHTPVNKKASYNMFIQNKTIRLLKQAAKNSWCNNTKTFFSNLSPFKGSQTTAPQFQTPKSNDWLSSVPAGVIGVGGGMLGSANSNNRTRMQQNRALLRYFGNLSNPK